MRIGACGLTSGNDDVCSRGKFGNEPDALGQYDHREKGANTPPLPSESRNPDDNEQHDQRRQFGLVERREDHAANVERNGASDSRRCKSNRCREHRYTDGYAHPQEANPRGVHYCVANSLEHRRIMHDQLAKDSNDD